ncbi:GNAT family N-acetyltransferase [Paracoccus onubensis]|uniref:GNAT family N-acetyltransferase n=1 Tax=Paracoccus onubensis TaxID=1675788 RepID=UPI002731AB84|nr:GNAT family N-acetyltransferase [Paracoccus onubensis]MDP0927481.1 GNAT family N-acetyltransferase [Paracoccus onubensis]
MKIYAPIPETILPEAAGLWHSAFGHRRGKLRVCPENAIVVISSDGLEGVVGLRDDKGGFLTTPPPLSRILFRPAPPTSDLVLDGIVVRHRRRGYGRALVAAAEIEARHRCRPGLRAEVVLRNRSALAFYQRLGFVEETRGWYGWPWSGRVVVLRKQV